MRKVKKVLGFHFDEGRSARAIATHCGLARRSVASVLERFAASRLSWPEAREMDDEALVGDHAKARVFADLDSLAWWSVDRRSADLQC